MDDPLHKVESKLDRARLKNALKRVEPPTLLVPKPVERTITQAGESKAAEIRRDSWRKPLFALAASVAVAGGLLFGLNQIHRQYADNDLNQDGAVDILDALTLAKAPSSSRKDFNNDGSINLGDAEWLAQEVVTLSRQNR